MTDSLQIFGILNCTPDSFSDGGKFLDVNKAVVRATQMLKTGADFIDVGGESTRPDARTIAPEQEWERVEAVLKALFDRGWQEKISLDTKNPETAEKFLKMGGKILNDVSGFQNPKMVELALQYEPEIIVNHFPGKSLQIVHEQEIDSIKKVEDDLRAVAEDLQKAGVKRDRIILDPGIGFGKTMYLNWELLTFARQVKDFPVMIGHSRKRFLGKDRFKKPVNKEAGKRAIANGARFLRVHDPEIYNQKPTN